ncbi:hypothetical protein [Bacillus sp. 1P06AnD]|uniref:hypothetical protein n=1 Tax=Bacillus sp. 1P06AnD TaxID=3132208 RepID=UPI0039A2E62E
MKSSHAQLLARGKVTPAELQPFTHYTKEELTALLASPKAHIRTIAITQLVENDGLNDDVIILFLQSLKQEDKLYTKLALCEALSKGGIISAERMVAYLGKIGSNQHTCLPAEPSKKTGYPLPRDIIARTLSHMGPEILLVLLNVLKTGRASAVSEAIDAIGFICFHNKISSETETQIAAALAACLELFKDDAVIRWKVVRAFESFYSEDILHTLTLIAKQDSQSTIRKEAQRSLRIIRQRQT